MGSAVIGLREQTVPNPKSLADACARHEWKVPPDYSAVFDCLDRHTDRLDRVCLQYADEDGHEERWTFRQMIGATKRFANALAGLGLGAGDVVAVHLPQRPETAIAHMAFYRLGVIGLPISKLFGPDAIRFRLDHSGAKAILMEPETLGKLDGIRKDLSELKHVIVVGGEATGHESFAELLRKGADTFAPRPTNAEDPILLMYTSGTTGDPKGVLHANRVILGHCGVDYSYNFLHDDDVYYSPADWAWAGGLLNGLLAPWAYGIGVLAYRTNQRFDPDVTYRLLEKYGATIGLYPPTALKVLRELPNPRERYKNLRLRCLVSGAEPVSPELCRWVDRELRVELNQGFGQTEANYLIGTCSALEPARLEPLGKPYPGHRIAVLDTEGTALPTGKIGEIAVWRHDPVVMKEYWRNPEATKEKFAGDWSRTGDLGYIDEEGWVWFEGRADDVIKTSGYRVGPAEVEASIMEVEGVASCAVIGVPDEKRGQAIKAFVKVLPGHDPSEELIGRIRSHVKSKLAAHEAPQEIEYIDEFPMTVTGKIKRRDLREQELKKRR